MPIVYILYSSIIDRYYVGHTEDLETRLMFHLSGKSPFTSRSTDWKLVYTEDFETKGEAIKRELEIKRKKSRKYIEFLIMVKNNDNHQNG